MIWSLYHLKQLDDILIQQGFRFTPTLALLLASTTLAGCSLNPLLSSDGESVLRNKSLDYAQSKVTNRILIPEGLNDTQVQSDLLTIPAKQLLEQPNGIEAAPRPDFVFAEAGSDSAHLTGGVNAKQISVAGSLAKVQGQVAQFWSNQDVAIEEVLDVQTVETQWFSLSEETLSDDFFSRWIRSLTKAEDDITYGRVKIELNEISQNRVELSLYFLQYTQLEITQNKGIDWQEAGCTLANESEITFELLRYLSRTSQVAQKTEENSQQYQTPLLGKDQFGRPLIQLNTGYDIAYPKVLKAMSVFDVGSFNEATQKIYFTHISHLRRFEKTAPASSGILGWFKGLHSSAAKEPGTNLDQSPLGGDDSAGSTDDLPVYSSNVNAVAEPTSLADIKGYKIWMGGKVIYVFEDEDQGVVNEDGEYTYVGEYQLSFETTLTTVYLQVLNNQGQPAAKVYAEEILWKLQQQLAQ